MTLLEFSSQFDILYNSIADNAAPPVNEYEKSVFLTQAQRDLIINIYSGRIKSMSFESTEEARRYLSTIEKELNSIALDKMEGTEYQYLPLFNNGVNKPEDLWFITLESCQLEEGQCLSGKDIEVRPVTHDDFHRTINNPFKGTTDRRVLRLEKDDKLYLYSKVPLKSYTMNYIKKPQPIILVDIQDTYGVDYTIEGLNGPSECELHPVLHKEILNLAVQYAKNAYISDNNVQQQNSK